MGSFLLLFEMKVIVAIIGAASAGHWKEERVEVRMDPYMMPCDGSYLDQGSQALLNYCSKVREGWPEISWCSKCAIKFDVSFCKHIWAYADNEFGNGRRRLLDDNDPS